MDAIAQIARTVLYEGYILWPYRRSALKNRLRWTLGGVYPEAYSKARGEDDPWTMQTQCLLEADGDAVLEVRVRFLHVVERKIARDTGGALEFVEELRIGGELYLSWDEATEREVVASGVQLAGLESPRRVPIDVAEGSVAEALLDAEGACAGAVIRSWRALRGALELRAERLGPRLYRVTASVVNTTPYAEESRGGALRHTFVSAHTVLHAAGGAFVSLIDPPEALRPASDECRNVGSWPVLAGREGERHTMLSSPIILYDYPQVAPESPGDLFDGTEIDRLLIMNVLALSDEEKVEMRASDPRAREILARCASLSPEQLMRLHGAIREFRPLREAWAK